MNILERFAELINHIAACNGSGRFELEKQVQEGKVSREEAPIIFAYACMQRINDKLDSMAKKVSV